MTSHGKGKVESADVIALIPAEITRLTLIGRRDVMFSRLQEVYNQSLRAFTDDACKDLFLCGMISLERLRSEFNDLVDKLNITELSLDPAYKVNYQSISAFDDMYCRSKFVFDKLNVAGHSGKLSVSEVLPQRKSVKLPKLELMEFSGEPIKWPIFYESFRRTIHENPELSDYERVQYLINKLSGRALSACSGIVPNADNYRTIWSTLVDMYEDKRNLAAAYLDQMLDCKLANSATSKNLASFLDKFCTAVSSLKSLKLDNLSDFMLLHIALKKIDSSTARSFEMHHRDTSMPTYDNLVKYIREQSKILDRIATSYDRSTNDNTTHALTATSPVCPRCKQNDHYTLYKCPEFIGCSIDERFNFIKDQGADDSFSSPSEIDVLIGAPLFSQILLSGRAAGPPGVPTALETIFGFIVIGNTPITTAHATTAITTRFPLASSMVSVAILVPAIIQMVESGKAFQRSDKADDIKSFVSAFTLLLLVIFVTLGDIAMTIVFVIGNHKAEGGGRCTKRLASRGEARGVRAVGRTRVALAWRVPIRVTISMHGVVPGWSSLLEGLCVIPGTIQTCAGVLRAGNPLAISPGGVFEAQFGDHYYKLKWKSRKGFAKVAQEAKIVSNLVKCCAVN
ncbi:hypothetical protein OBRU01_01602 [Operophtera brumata]|uniref:Uncharacterized protein n=1 Tax=Operophtera brumata TaxID=104452 RepID=A0A0L7LTH9_OPEBR|nr:hypothetical protein OBRU01_01602 [Operophtera brumata]